MRCLPPKPLHLLPAHRSRSFVSASRVLDVLRQRLGCIPTGDRGSASEYWVTPKGARFRVADPTADQNAPVVTATGRRSLYYSYQYAAALLYHVSWLVAHGRPEDETPRPHDDGSFRLVETAAPPTEARPVGDLTETIFV